MIQNSVFLEFPKQRVRFEILPSQKVYTKSLLVPIKLKKIYIGICDSKIFYPVQHTIYYITAVYEITKRINIVIVICSSKEKLQ